MKEQKLGVSSWKKMGGSIVQNQSEIERMKIKENGLKQDLADEKKRIAVLQKQNTDKAKREKIYSDKTAQLAK